MCVCFLFVYILFYVLFSFDVWVKKKRFVYKKVVKLMNDVTILCGLTE